MTWDDHLSLQWKYIVDFFSSIICSWMCAGCYSTMMPLFLHCFVVVVVVLVVAVIDENEGAAIEQPAV